MPKLANIPLTTSASVKAAKEWKDYAETLDKENQELRDENAAFRDALENVYDDACAGLGRDPNANDALLDALRFIVTVAAPMLTPLLSEQQKKDLAEKIEALQPKEMPPPPPAGEASPE